MRIIILILVISLSFISNALVAQSNYTVSGSITDSLSGESMIGALVLVKDIPGTAVACNEYGYYSLQIPEGAHVLEVRFIGYDSKTTEINLKENIKLHFKLVASLEEIDVVVVSVKQENDNIINERMGVEKLDMREVKKMPVLFGEQDIIKTFTLTPGVKTSGEGSGGMFVRGGNNSQNLVLLDEATVYNTSHLLGFFSTFNSDAIKDVSLYKGTASAEYGGRISSVMDVKMNEGNNQKFRVGGGVGLIASRLNVEGPLVKDRSSFMIAGRRTYADLFLKLSPDAQLNNNKLYFYDLNAKANYKINENNRVFLSGYFGRDVVSFADRFGIDWGNSTGTLRWAKIWGDKLFSNTSLIYSDYDYKATISRTESEFSLKSVINNWNLKHEFEYYADKKNSLSFGLSSVYHSVTPGQLEVPEDSEIKPEIQQDRYGLENAVYISNNWKPNPRWNIKYGIRASSFSGLGAGDFYTYDSDGNVLDTASYGNNEVVETNFFLEPRINIAYILNESSSIKTSYTRNTQNLHLIQNSNSSTPTDIWVLSSKNIKTEIGDQVALGYFKNLKKNAYQFSSEVYYRSMQNQLDLKNGAEIRANEHIEGELLFGIGRSYGLELMMKKKQGKLHGWVAYTLSRTERKIDGINSGNWYAARQDATHDISVVGIYDVNKKWSLSSTWVYNTGNAVTFPSGKYSVNGDVQFYYTERNGYRMPNYHRMDFSATRFFKKTAQRESSLSFGLYNAYGRKNAYTIDFEEDPNDPTKTHAIKTYLFTFVPSLTYNFKF